MGLLWIHGVEQALDAPQAPGHLGCSEHRGHAAECVRSAGSAANGDQRAAAGRGTHDGARYETSCCSDSRAKAG